MSTTSDFYYAVFYFWFRIDLLTRRREDRALKALGAVTVVQVWLVVGGWWWSELLMGRAWSSFGVSALAIVALFAANYAVLRRGGWEDFEKRFLQMSARVRTAWMLFAGGVSIAALALLLSAAVFARRAH